MSKKQPKSPKQIKIFLTIISFVAIALPFARLVLANSLSTKSDQLKELEKQKQQLIYENLKIKNEIAKKMSLAYIEEETGKKLGMVKAASASKVEFIKIREENLAWKKEELLKQ